MFATLVKSINGALRPLGVELRRISFPFFAPAPDRFEPIVDRAMPFSTTTRDRVIVLCETIDHIVTNVIPGDFVECGVWRGGSAMAAALAFKMCGDERRDLHLFDTFEGMSRPSIYDVVTGTGKVRTMKEGDLRAPIDDVVANMRSTGYDMARVHFHPGLVEKTLPAEAPAKIAVLRLDTDFYESTKHELETLWPRVAPGGFLIIDDYGHWAGVKKAVDEYFGPAIFLFRIDYTGRLVRKPGT